jgi:hypothetical protein
VDGNVEWDGNGATADGPGPVNRLTLPESGGWPSRIGGYAKLLWTAATTLGTTGILTWLQSAGATHLPSWVAAGITAVIGIGTVLLSPRNKA